MIRIAVLLAFVVLFYSGCGKRVVKEEMSLENEGISSSTASTTEETAAPSSAMEATSTQTPAVTESSTQEAVTMAPVDAVIPEAKTITDKPTPKNIQTALKNAGFYEGKIDGTLGPKTKKAIENFQIQNNLKADGKVGPKTWSKLQAFLSQPAANFQ